MTPQPVKKMGNGQLNLNTVLLTITMGLSAWALKSIEQLKEQVAGQVPITTANSNAIMSINGVQAEQSNKIGILWNRVTVLETMQADFSKNKK